MTAQRHDGRPQPPARDEPNQYTQAWFDTFLRPIDSAQTEAEARGLARWLPLPAFRRVLDLCCGAGRHAAVLSRLGYDVTGVDRDAAALDLARRAAPAAAFVRLDMRDLDRLPGTFDAAAILWQSYGYFSEAANDDVLRGIAARLRPGGRLALDVYHPGYFARNQGRRESPRPGVDAITDALEGKRLRSRIEYADGAAETMDFQLYPPAELADRAKAAGFQTVATCCWWDPARPPDPTVARYQLIAERHG